MREQIRILATNFIAWLMKFRIEVSITITLFIITVATRLPVTLSFPIEVGVDGAYYTLNVYTLLNGGFLYYDAPIVAFAIAGIFSFIAHDIIIGVKIASAFFEAVLVVGIFFAAYIFTEGDWRTGLIAGVLCLIDVSQFLLATSWVKNQAALAFLPFALVFFYRFMYQGRRLGDFLAFLCFGCLTTLSHLMTAVILFVTLIMFSGYEFLKQLWAREWRIALLKVGLPLLAGGLVFLGIYAGLDFLIPAADTWLTSSSLLKASEYSTSLLSGDNVYNFIEFLIMGFNPLSNPVTWDLWLHLAIAILIVLGTISLLIRNKPGDRVALSFLFSIVLLGVGLASWAFRFYGMLFVPFFLILAMGLIVIVDLFVELIAKHFWKLQTIRYGKKILTLIIILLTLGGILCVAVPRYFYAAEFIRPRAFPQDLDSIEAMEGMFPNDVKLYALHGTEYFITSRTWYEAAPESGSANFPVYAAQRMYYHINNESRPSYYVLQPWSNFHGNLEPIANDLLEVTSFGYFNLFKDTLEINIQTTQTVYTMRCVLISMVDPSVFGSIMLTESASNIWQGNLSLVSFPDGMFRLQIIPNTSPPPSPPNPAYTIGDDESLLIYHFEALPLPHVRLHELLVLEGTPGWFRVYGVNTTTAATIDLLNLEVELPDFPGPPRPPELYMLVLTPLYYVPFYGELSNFVIIFVLAPLIGLYWLLGGLLIIELIRRIHRQLSITIRTAPNQSAPMSQSLSPTETNCKLQNCNAN